MITATFLPLLLTLHPVVPLHTYNSLQNGIMVEIQLGAVNDVAKLILFDANHNQLAPPATITSGTHDVASRIPAIRDLEKAAWLQLTISGSAVAPPIVIQPLTSREIPIIEESLRPDGVSTYTKIIGWKDETEEDDLESPFMSGWRVYEDKNAIIETSKGDIRISLRPDVAPNTVWNFRELIIGDFYQNTTFHRIVPMASKGYPFVIQGGDPTGTGSGGPGYWLPIENSDLPHDFGVISMARGSDPDSAGSQFFLCLSREGTARLDGQYCSFGETIEGKEVIRTIAATPLSDPATGKPVDPPKIKSITLIPALPIY